MDYLREIDYTTTEYGELYDELPLWSAFFGRMLLEQVELRTGITILDVGAGTGFLTIELAQRCGADAVVIAIDPWQSALARLRRRRDSLGLSNIHTLAQDISAVDLPEASADLIVSNLGINNFENPKAAVRQCFRLAKPGARLYLTTNLVGHMQELYHAYRSVLVELGFSDRLAALDEHIQHRATVPSVQHLLEAAGFEFVNAVTGTFRERFADGSSLLRHHFIRLGFLPGWKQVAPPAAIEPTFAALEVRLNSLAAQTGGLSLTVPAACIEARKPVGR